MEAVIIDFVQTMWALALAGEIQGIWFFTAIYCFVLCSYSTLRQISNLNWHSTWGSLTRLQVDKFGAGEWAKSDQNYASSALYEYKVDGKNYTGKRISPWIFVVSHNAKFVLERQLKGAEIDNNGRVKVFYNPKNPQKSYLILPNIPGIVITLAIAIVPMISFYFKFY